MDHICFGFDPICFLSSGFQHFCTLDTEDTCVLLFQMLTPGRLLLTSVDEDIVFWYGYNGGPIFFNLLLQIVDPLNDRRFVLIVDVEHDHADQFDFRGQFMKIESQLGYRIALASVEFRERGIEEEFRNVDVDFRLDDFQIDR